MDALSAKAVLLQELSRGPGCGFDLIARVRTVSGGVVTIAGGSAYPALRELERDRLIESAGVEPRGDRGGRPRQLYRLTEAGRVAAAEHRAGVLALYGGQVEPAPDAGPRRFVVLDGDEPEGAP